MILGRYANFSLFLACRAVKMQKNNIYSFFVTLTITKFKFCWFSLQIRSLLGCFVVFQ